jgi:hypothetical protein
LGIEKIVIILINFEGAGIVSLRGGGHVAHDDVGLCCVSSSIMSPPLCFVHTFSHSLIHPSQLSHDNACTPQAYLVDRLDSCVGRCPRFAVQIRCNHVGVQSGIRAQCACVAGSKLAHAVTISCCSTGCSHLRTRR